MKEYGSKVINQGFVKKIVCDFCGKTIIEDEGEILEEFGTLDMHFGYGSQKDGDCYNWDICDACGDKILALQQSKPAGASPA